MINSPPLPSTRLSDTKSPPIRTAVTSPPLEPGKTSTPNSVAGAPRRQKPFGEYSGLCRVGSVGL